MKKINQKGIIHILVLLILLAGLGVGLYLSQHPQIFKPRADVSGARAEFVDAAGNPINATTNADVRLRIIRNSISADAAATPTPSPTQTPSPVPGVPGGSTSSPIDVCGGVNCQATGSSSCPSGHSCWFDGLGNGKCINPGGRDYLIGDQRVPYSCSFPRDSGPQADSDGDGDPNSSDCAPNDARAHHGVTGFFTSRGPSGGFDYNCDGVETKQYTNLTTLPATTGTIYSSGPGPWCNSTMPAGSPGYISTIPECGDYGAFRYCTMFTEAGCRGTSQSSDGSTCGTGVGPLAGEIATDPKHTAMSWAIVDGGQGSVAGSVPQSCN